MQLGLAFFPVRRSRPLRVVSAVPYPPSPPTVLARDAQLPGSRRRRRRRRRVAGAPRSPGRRGQGGPVPGSRCLRSSRRADRRAGPELQHPHPGAPPGAAHTAAARPPGCAYPRQDAARAHRGEAQPAAERQPLLAPVILVSAPLGPASPSTRCSAPAGSRRSEDAFPAWPHTPGTPRRACAARLRSPPAPHACAAPRRSGTPGAWVAGTGGSHPQARGSVGGAESLSCPRMPPHLLWSSSRAQTAPFSASLN